MNIGYKYLFGLLIGSVFMLFGFFFPPEKKPKSKKISEIETLLMSTRKNIHLSQDLNKKIDSTNAITDSLIKINNAEIMKIKDELGYKDNFLVSEKDTIVVKVKK